MHEARMGGQQHDGCFFGEGRKDAAAVGGGGGGGGGDGAAFFR